MKRKDNLKDSLKKRGADWLKDTATFWTVFLNLWVLLPTIAGILLIFYSAQQTDKTTIAVLTAIASTFVGIAGGLASHKWLKYIEESSITARGVEAIRNLKLLNLHIQSICNGLEQRLEDITEEDAKVDPFPKMVFEELISRLRLTQEAALSAIETWNGVVPNADISSQIGEISELSNRIVSLQMSLKDRDKKLELAKEEGEDKEAELKKKFSLKEEQLQKEIEKLREHQSSFSTFTGASVSPSTSVHLMDNKKGFTWNNYLSSASGLLGAITPGLLDKIPCRECCTGCTGILLFNLLL